MLAHMLFAYQLFPSILFQMLPSENVNHHSPQLQAVKQDIVEVRNEMKADNAQLKAEIVSRVEKLITNLEAKLDVVLAKPSEK